MCLPNLLSDRFCNKAFEKNSDEYDCACQLSLAVAETVEEIKRNAIVSHCGF